MPKEIFVFGSNLGGLHGGGSAHHAHENLGAVWGVGVGPTGDCYAIPTKGVYFTKRNKMMIGDALRVEDIKPYVDQFIQYAEANPDLTFNVVEIGCGLAGFTPREIAPLFELAPSNVKLSPSFVSEITRIITDYVDMTNFGDV